LPEYSVRAAFLNPLPKPAGDRILEYYRDPGYRDAVVAFFATLCGSPNVAAVILSNAAAQNVSPSLAFALCWEESRYNPRAVNRKNRNESVDRGLFQLNNRSFPNIADADFFNPSINAWYGLSHLRLCLDTGGTEVAALAMYNAGTGRVRSLGAPKITLDYIQRILEVRQKIERIFAAEFSLSEEPFLAKGPEPASPGPENETAVPGKSGLNPALASAKPSRSWLARLAPLSGNR
jgi:soluble lytic murein transglycosylase-like protein